MHWPKTNSWPAGHSQADPFHIIPPEQVCAGTEQTPLMNISPAGHTHAKPLQYDPPEHVGGGGGEVPHDEHRHDGLVVPSRHIT